MNLRVTIGHWIQRQCLRFLTHRCVVHGFQTVIVNTRPEIQTREVIARLNGALALLEKYVPHHYQRLRRDFSGFLIERRAYRGAFIVATRTCLVELTFIVNPAFTLSQVAATTKPCMLGCTPGASPSHRTKRIDRSDFAAVLRSSLVTWCRMARPS